MVLANPSSGRFIPRMDPGELNTRVTLLTPTISTDAGAAQKATYADFATNPDVWAKIVYAHGMEAVSAEALKSPARLTLTIRYRSDVDGTHAVRLNSQVWKFISEPDNILNRNQYLEIQAELVKGSV